MNPKFMSAPEREAYRIGYERGRLAKSSNAHSVGNIRQYCV